MPEFIFAGTILLLSALAGLATWVLSRPDTFRVERRTTINAPAEKIFPLLNDFHAWRAWSPWEKLDPEMKRDYGGPAAGVGANYSWDSKKAGAGRMEIAEAAPSSKLVVKLDFTKPMTAHNMVDFVLSPTGGGTDVVWAMYGPQTLISKIMSLFFSMDKLVGKDFESGLANLKAAAEK